MLLTSILADSSEKDSKDAAFLCSMHTDHYAAELVFWPRRENNKNIGEQGWRRTLWPELDSVPKFFFFIDYRASPKNNDDAFIDGVYVVNVHSRLVKF